MVESKSRKCMSFTSLTFSLTDLHYVGLAFMGLLTMQNFQRDALFMESLTSIDEP
jgi:hypothetical protein